MSQINVGFDNNSPQAIDRSYGALSVGSTIPYVSAAAAVAAINSAFRYRGKTVLIDPGDGSGAYEYWWRVGIADAQLIPKILYEQTLDFIIGDGGLYTPADQSVGLVNPSLVNCLILGITGDQGAIPLIVRSGYQYASYNKTSGTITLTNTLFSLGAWWSIKYRQL